MMPIGCEQATFLIAFYMPGADRFVPGQGRAILWLLEVSLSRLALTGWPVSTTHRQVNLTLPGPTPEYP